MKARVIVSLGLAVSLAACGGVRDRIRDAGPITSTRFDGRELIDVLPPDRIRAIDRPTFEHPDAAAGWLEPEEPVVVVSVGSDARAYPLAILVWHEVVNDAIGGVPVAVTYSPLTNSALAYDLRVGGRVESFGVSGKLYRSNLVMVDRRTTSLWTQFDGRAVAGPSKGAVLNAIPAQISSLTSFRASYPSGGVLARPGDSAPAYGFNPYAGYDSRREPFRGFVAVAPNRGFSPMARLVGTKIGDTTTTWYFYDALRGPRVVYPPRGGRLTVVLWEPGTRSALDTADISEGKDVGSAGVFVPVARGLKLDLSPATGGFRDGQTGSTWSVLGVATAGRLKGERLAPIPHVDTFWFAWSAFHVEPGP